MWDEQASLDFMNYGRYFVPAREKQMRILCDLIPEPTGEFHVLELSCGEGLLAETILARFPASVVHGYDGSPAMLQKARERLSIYGSRFESRSFDLTSRAWRQANPPYHAILSSLAIHHLDDGQKRTLFADLQPMLAPGGLLAIADLIQPATKAGEVLAARAWDEAVRQRSLALDGDETAYNAFKSGRWNTYRYPDPIDKPSRLLAQLKWLEEAGFTDADVYWMDAGHAIFAGFKPAT